MIHFRLGLFTMRINLRPNVEKPENGGVLQVSYHLRKGLEELGHEVSDEGLVHGHAFEASDEVYTSHGIYPGSNPLNRKLFNNLCRAQIVTAVSKWTAKQISHIRKDVIVIPNGVDLERMKRVPRHAGDYILWAKNNADDTRNPQAFIELAKANPTLRFVMTVCSDKEVPKNLEVIGLQQYDRMLEILAGARLYVSTGTENFPIQVLEAMALGTPVLALPKGGVPEISGIYLTEDLQTGLEYCLAHRPELVKKQSSEIELYDWKNIARMYVEVYQKIRPAPSPKVSVIIPVYNYAKSVGRAIDSVLAQDHKADEVIVVDDGSTDDLHKALKPYQGRIKVIRQKNSGVAKARNRGILEANGDFICCLDADDELSTNFIAETYHALNNDRGLGIAYPSLAVKFDGKYRSHPPRPFDFEQLTKGNFIPCANLFRKQAWERAGGYKNINPSWEDYDLWLSITELGYEAQGVPGASLGYTVHDNGRTAQEKNGNFSKLLRATVDGYHPSLYSQKGWVTFIIPCYQQWQYVEQAIESVFQQTYPHVKAIVVDDASPDRPSQDYLEKLVKKYPKLGIAVRQVNGGLSAARNTGIKACTTDYVVMLDADDKVHPDFVAECLKVGYDTDKYVYSDTLTWHSNGSTEPMDMPDFDCQDLLKRHQHACAILIPRKWLEEVGGYDESMKQGWEDYELAMRLVKANHCGLRVKRPLMYYRWRENSMRQQAELVKKDINFYIWKKHPDLKKKGFATMCCTGKKVSVPIYQDPNEANNIVVPEGYILIEYGGSKQGLMRKQGGQGRRYEYSSTQRYFPVHKNDLSLFSARFRQVIKRAKPVVVEAKPIVLPEGDEDLKVVEGVTEELETILKQNGITTKLKLIATPDKKMTELTGDRKLTKSIKPAAILLSKPVENEPA